MTASSAPRLNRFNFQDLILYLGLTILSLLTIAPMVWIIFLSFKSKQGFAASPFGLPESFNLENYITVLTDERLIQFLFNSIVVTLTSVFLILAACIMAAYALARINFRGSSVLFVVFFLSDAIPLFVVLVPLFILIQLIGITGSLWSLILPYTAMHIGVAVFIFRGFFRNLSSEIEDAARIDGCNTMQMLWYVLVPLIRPAVIVVAIVTFISIWNEYFLAAILLPSQDLFTLPAGLASAFIGKYSTNWPVMAAGIVLSVLPIFLLFLMAQERIVEGWTTGHK
ncbi:MAG: carbohydrate ABC transporter permease [Anaerolineales bacterium]|nr:carbohydrate ABC transporter permease [Anaerolineales bacterium]